MPATELAHHLPLTVVSHLVGLPDNGRERMLEWGNAAFETLGSCQRSRSHSRLRRPQPRYDNIRDYQCHMAVCEQSRPVGLGA
jgi:cytochrome P450